MSGLFKYREIVTTGLRERHGSFAFTTGIFRITTYIDAGLADELEDTQRFVLAHETAHALYKHGLIAALLFPLRPFLLPVLEACADRYAVKQIGRKAGVAALRRLWTLYAAWSRERAAREAA